VIGNFGNQKKISNPSYGGLQKGGYKKVAVSRRVSSSKKSPREEGKERSNLVAERIVERELLCSGGGERREKNVVWYDIMGDNGKEVNQN